MLKCKNNQDDRVDGRIYSAISSPQFKNDQDDRADGKVTLHWHQFTTNDK